MLGVDAQRGDTVSVQNMTFDDASATDVPPTFFDKLRGGLTDYSTAVRYSAMLLLFFLVWALMFRPMQKQMAGSLKELAAGSPQAALLTATSKPELSPVVSPIALESEAESTVLKRELSELVQAEPASMTRTLQAWLREDHA